MKEETKKVIKELLYQIVVIFIAAMALIGTIIVVKQIIGGNNKNIPITKDKGEPIENSIIEPEINLPADTKENEMSLSLLSEPFFPPQNIYSDLEVYNNNLINLALIGEFEKVEIKVSGKISNDLDNFISVNIDGISGTLGGYRKSINTLDLDKTTGIFNKSNSIDFVLDLKESTKFSTTKEEFSSTFESTKNVIIWDKIKPPSYTGRGTIAKFLIAPYNEKGKYGDGVSIDSIEFRYTCKVNSDSCAVVICEKDKNYTFGSECLKEHFEKKFGKQSWESYADYFK